MVTLPVKVHVHCLVYLGLDRAHRPAFSAGGHDHDRGLVGVIGAEPPIVR